MTPGKRPETRGPGRTGHPPSTRTHRVQGPAVGLRLSREEMTTMEPMEEGAQVRDGDRRGRITLIDDEQQEGRVLWEDGERTHHPIAWITEAWHAAMRTRAQD